MTRFHVPLFVLAPLGQLPTDPLSWPALVEAQSRGVRRARRLRIFTSPEGSDAGLEELIQQGAGSTRPICDALVPHLEIGELSLGVYELQGEGRGELSGHPADTLTMQAFHCLDEMPLTEVANDACWFYPTDAGTYLACSTAAEVRQLPGHQPERGGDAEPVPYRRDQLRQKLREVTFQQKFSTQMQLLTGDSSKMFWEVPPCFGYDICGTWCGDGRGCESCGRCGRDASTGQCITMDACGVCNGDGSSCKGCDGKSFSGLVYDACKVCGVCTAPIQNSG